MKFTQTGAVSVSVRPSPIPPSSDSMEILEFTVEDTGAGIPEGKEPYLFTEFLQFDNAASLEYKGTGLGLAISKRLVEFLDGKIWYKKRTPQGSAFGFTIQVRKNNNPEYFSEDTVVSDISAAGLKGLKILIAEDNSSNRIFLSEHLGRYGCVIREAGNGFDCLKKHSEEQADIILMDVNMPVLNGLETARKIRAEEKAMNRLPVTIIGLTAYALKGDRERFLVGGFTDYLSKPFHIRDLLRKLSEYA
ncbi:MAG: response regulator [Spirochaetales bacterium]|nr:MAG: response regulator [Spirochaetales bacterium]